MILFFFSFFFFFFSFFFFFFLMIRRPPRSTPLYSSAASDVYKRTAIINISSVVGIAVELLNGVYSASKSYVLSFGHTLQRDLADKGVRVQTVLPGGTITEFWDVAGYAKQKESPKMMTAEDLVDAALAGLDQGELVTIPTLQDGEDWARWEAARRELTPKFANPEPAPRYGLATA